MPTQKLDILCYHAVSPGPRPLNDFCFMPLETFRAHMRWLRKSRIKVLPLTEAAQRLAEGRLDGRTVAITFDDGFRNNISVALPVLEEVGLPATIFLSTGFIGTASTTWAARITRALQTTRAMQLDFAGTRFDLDSETGKEAANRSLQRLVKQRAPADPGKAVAAIEARLDVPVNPDVTGDADFQMMGPEDVARGVASGLISFGGHSVTHPLLSALDDAGLEREVSGSVAAVAALTGQPCASFAFPNGQPQDFDDRAIALLRKAGVRVAATTTQLVNEPGADPMRLSRWVLGGGVSPARLRATLMGLHPNQLKHRWRQVMPSRS